MGGVVSMTYGRSRKVVRGGELSVTVSIAADAKRKRFSFGYREK